PETGTEMNRSGFYDAKRFRFRVRQIRIPRGETPAWAYAVTDGCCAGVNEQGQPADDPTHAHNLANLLVYNPTPDANGPRARWFASTLDPYASAVGDCGGALSTTGSSFYQCDPVDPQTGGGVN